MHLEGDAPLRVLYLGQIEPGIYSKSS